MKSYVRSIILLCSLLWLPINAISEDSSNSAKTYGAIQQLKIDIRRANVVFYRLMNDATNATLYQQIPPQLKALEEQWNNLKTQLDTESQPISKTEQLWNQYHQVVMSNREDIYRDGYPVNQLVNDMLTKKLQLLSSLDVIADNLQYKPSEFLSTSYQQSKVMLDIAELYGELSVSLVGNPLVSDEMTLDEMCELFNTTLESLKAASSNAPESKALVKDISSKWHFIEKSVRNHQENMVPYLVARYSDAILDKLHNLNELYLQKQ